MYTMQIYQVSTLKVLNFELILCVFVSIGDGCSICYITINYGCLSLPLNYAKTAEPLNLNFGITVAKMLFLIW